MLCWQQADQGFRYFRNIAAKEISRERVIIIVLYQALYNKYKHKRCLVICFPGFSCNDGKRIKIS